MRTNANDSLGLAAIPASSATALSGYLMPRTAGLRYELAVDEPLALAPLVIHDRRPILPLTSFGGIPLTSLASLLAAVRAGEVRYGLVAQLSLRPAQPDVGRLRPRGSVDPANREGRDARRA